MTAAVVARVACPECGAQKAEQCRKDDNFYADQYVGTAHLARWEALWALNRLAETETRPA